MKYKVEFLKSAVEDLEEIILYVAHDDKNAALELQEKILSSVIKLERFPKVGKLIPEPKLSKKGYRMLLVSAYIIFYRIIDETVYIYRILHGSRNYPILFFSEN